jgi:hypothetical protein
VVSDIAEMIGDSSPALGKIAPEPGSTLVVERATRFQPLTPSRPAAASTPPDVLNWHVSILLLVRIELPAPAQKSFKARGASQLTSGRSEIRNFEQRARSNIHAGTRTQSRRSSPRS